MISLTNIDATEFHAKYHRIVFLESVSMEYVFPSAILQLHLQFHHLSLVFLPKLRLSIDARRSLAKATTNARAGTSAHKVVACHLKRLTLNLRA